MITYTVTLPDLETTQHTADSLTVRDGALVFVVDNQPVRGYAPGQWLRFAGEPQPDTGWAAPAAPAARPSPRILPATNPTIP